MATEDGTDPGGVERPRGDSSDSAPPHREPSPPNPEPRSSLNHPPDAPAVGGPRPEEEAGDAARTAGGAAQRPKRTTRGVVLETLFLLLIAAVVALLIQSFLIKAFMIPSSSMSPTLQIGDRVMVEKLTYYFREPRRGDIIVFRYPPREPGAMNTSKWFYWPFEQIGETLHLTHRGVTPYVKRVVATGGETVELRKGKLYINGKRVEEDYVVDDNGDFGPVAVPEDSLFMMGDNRPNSRDSRFWGTVPKSSVIGKVFLIWWPPKRFGAPG